MGILDVSFCPNYLFRSNFGWTLGLERITLCVYLFESLSHLVKYCSVQIFVSCLILNYVIFIFNCFVY